MTHTTAADWSVAVFSSRESVSHLQKVVAACELACRERSAIIDVIVNGNVNRPGFIGGLFPREDGADVHRNTICSRVA